MYVIAFYVYVKEILVLQLKIAEFARVIAKLHP